MFITHKGKVMKNKRNQKNIIWKILLIIFSIVLIICLIIIGIQKYQQKKQQEYYEALLENAGSQSQATEEVPEPETEESPVSFSKAGTGLSVLLNRIVSFAGQSLSRACGVSVCLVPPEL